MRSGRRNVEETFDRNGVQTRAEALLLKVADLIGMPPVHAGFG